METIQVTFKDVQKAYEHFERSLDFSEQCNFLIATLCYSQVKILYDSLKKKFENSKALLFIAVVAYFEDQLGGNCCIDHYIPEGFDYKAFMEGVKEEANKMNIV